MGVRASIETYLYAQFSAQVKFAYLWYSVAFASGVGGYFFIPIEPGYWPAWGLFVLSVFWASTSWARPVLLCFAVLTLGYAWSGVTAHRLAEPVLDKRWYGTVTGVVALVDLSASDKYRITLTDVMLSDVSANMMPARVRVALHGDTVPPKIGSTIRVKAHLSPPPGPAEPYGFDFQRHAWFLQLGGVGYARKPIDVIAHAHPNIRAKISAWVTQNLSDKTAGIGRAIITGDRSELDKDVVDSLRRANLAHLLAISGLHMGLLVGLVFGIIRLTLLFLPVEDPKRIAAVAALFSGAVYLWISGASIATERAFVMTAVVLVAVMLRKRALTLRAVALAVWIVLILRPYAIFSPGFHMSFSATIALVVAFQGVSKWKFMQTSIFVKYVSSAILSSVVAGLATAPFAAAHFNMIPHYGVASNVLAVPIMAFVVIPSFLAACFLSVVDLAWIPFIAMDWALNMIVKIADIVSEWHGAVTHVKSAQPYILVLFTIGAVFGLLWQGILRLCGPALILCAVLLWVQTPRPDILISDTATIVGILGPSGRVVSRPKGSGFSARVWLENDGDSATQEVSANRPLDPEKEIQVLRKWPETDPPCTDNIIVVADYVRNSKCEIFDLTRLRRTGSIAGYYTDKGIKWISANRVSGRRLWNNRWVRRDTENDALWHRAELGFPNQ